MRRYCASLFDERRERRVVEMPAEPTCHEERKAELLRPRVLVDPRAECPLARRGDRERATVARARGAGLDQRAGLERAELAIHVALGHVPEPGETGLRLLHQLPARLGTVVQQAEERALGGVQRFGLGHLTFPCGG
jgi:hypothetical protein